MSDGELFPILQGRKMYPKGILGEFAAMIRRPSCVADFEKWGCNYWGKWADENGKLNLDYGNSWFDFNGVNQVAQLKEKLKNNPTDRRMIITGWKPDGMEDLSLPCCHCFYQFYVRDGKYLDMIWYQRSVDLMIGLPSDIVFAAAWLISLANEFGLSTGIIKFDLGDCHIYSQHLTGALEYIAAVDKNEVRGVPKYYHSRPIGTDFCDFKPDDIHLNLYGSCKPIKLELIA